MANKVQKAVSLDGDVIESIQELADSLDWSFSKTAARLLELGLRRHKLSGELDAANKENKRLRARLSARG